MTCPDFEALDLAVGMGMPSNSVGGPTAVDGDVTAGDLGGRIGAQM